MIKPRDMLRTFEKLNLHKDKRSIYELIKSLDTKDNNENGVNFD